MMTDNYMILPADFPVNGTSSVTYGSAVLQQAAAKPEPEYWHMVKASPSDPLEAFEIVPPDEYGPLGEYIPEGWGYWSHAKNDGWYSKGVTPNGEIVDELPCWCPGYQYIRPKKKQALCGCKKHQIDPTKDAYQQHNDWVRSMGIPCESGGGIKGAVKVDGPKPIYVAQVEEQYGEEF